MPTWSARTAPTMRSSTKGAPTPTTCLCSTTSYAAGNIPTTVCVHTSPWPTSLHWNLSLAGNTILERQSVTNLLDEYSTLYTLEFIAMTPNLLGSSLQNSGAISVKTLTIILKSLLIQIMIAGALTYSRSIRLVHKTMVSSWRSREG